MIGFWGVLSTVILSGILWRLSGLWEWRVPERISQKILAWKRLQYRSQVILRVTSEASIGEIERFARLMNGALPKLQLEIGVPIAVEIEWDAFAHSVARTVSTQTCKGREEKTDVEDEASYLACLSRRFPHFEWLGQMQCE